MHVSQIVYNSKTFGGGVKWSEIWDSRTLVSQISSTFDLVVFMFFGGHSTYIWDSLPLVTHIVGTLDLVGFQIILRSFRALVSKWPVTPK